MAKVAFSKLEVKPNVCSCSLFYCNSKGEEVHYDVKYYLPVQEKMEMISNIINQSIDDKGYYNTMRLKIFTVLEVTYAYTNLSFTEKQKENPFKLYDLLVGNGIFKEIVKCIYEDDWEEIQQTILSMIDNIYKYKNSAMGVMETITGDYANLELDAKNIQEILKDPESLTLVKDVLTKLG